MRGGRGAADGTAEWSVDRSGGRTSAAKARRAPVRDVTEIPICRSISSVRPAHRTGLRGYEDDTRTMVQAPARRRGKAIEMLNVADRADDDAAQRLHTADPHVVNVDQNLAGRVEAVGAAGSQPIAAQSSDRVVCRSETMLGQLFPRNRIAIRWRLRPACTACARGTEN